MIEQLKRYRVGILAGGPSSERDVSLKSGAAVFKALAEAGLDVTFMDVNAENLLSILKETGVNVAFIALHGRFGEDGDVQALLERAGIPYTGSGPLASRLAMDKVLSKEAFVRRGLRVAGHIVVAGARPVPGLRERVPCVVKPRHEGSSMGLTVVRDPGDVENAVGRARAFGEDVMVEDFIPGREITVGVLDGAPLPVVEIITAEGVYDYSAKYRSADTKYICPADVGEDEYKRLQEAGLAAHEALGCRGFSRVDMRLTHKGEVYILEVNTIPGLTQRSLLPLAAKRAGLDFQDLCVKMLRGAEYF